MFVEIWRVFLVINAGWLKIIYLKSFRYEGINLIMNEKHALQLFNKRDQSAGQPNKVIPLWCFVTAAPHHAFLGPVVCYQYEASCERANERAEPVTQMKRVFKSCLLMRTFPLNAVGHRAPPSSPLPPLLFGQWLRVNTKKSAWHVYSSVKMNPRWSPINQLEQKGSNSQGRHADQ